MTANSYATITIRGVEFADAEAAAAAFGVSKRHIQNALCRGRIDRVGIPPHLTRRRSGQEPMPVMIRGRLFASAEAAAAHFGIMVSTVYWQIGRGRADFIGLGKSRKHRTGRPGPAAQKPKPVTIGSFHWKSRRECAAALGVHVATLRLHLKAGDMEWLRARAMKAAAMATANRLKATREADSAAIKDARIAA